MVKSFLSHSLSFWVLPYNFNLKAAFYFTMGGFDPSTRVDDSFPYVDKNLFPDRVLNPFIAFFFEFTISMLLLYCVCSVIVEPSTDVCVNSESRSADV